MCTRPLDAYKNPDGGRPIFGYEGVRNGLPLLKLPCGKCPECCKDYYSMWAARGSRELYNWDSSLFITLTYDEAHLPHDRSLNKKHIQDFIKRVKLAHGSSKENPIRQTYCGEYGSRTLRPHYHCILYNADFADKRPHRLSDQGHQIYTSKELTQLWGYGHVEFGFATPASIAYLYKYILKKKSRKEKEQPLELEIDGTTYEVAHEFIESSRNPGIGASLRGSSSINKGYLAVNGVRQKLPKYYMEDLKKNDPRRAEVIADKRYEYAKSQPKESWERLRQKEEAQKLLTDSKKKL